MFFTFNKQRSRLYLDVCLVYSWLHKRPPFLSSSIELLFERTAITSIARFSLRKSGRGRVWSLLNLPSLKLSLTWISSLSLDKIDTELSISCLTLTGRFVPFGHSLILYTTRLYLRSSSCLAFSTGFWLVAVIDLSTTELLAINLPIISAKICSHLPQAYFHSITISVNIKHF